MPTPAWGAPAGRMRQTLGKKSSKCPMTRRNSNRKGRTALLLVRTPLQAWLAEQVLCAEDVSRFDLLYFTHDDSPEDRHYFARLAEQASDTQYCHAPPRRFDILGHLDFAWQTRRWRRPRGYDLTLMASIDAPVINAIASRQASGDLVTFDDGLANIRPTGPYHVLDCSWRVRFYRRQLGAMGLVDTKARITRHYTIFPGFPNIVPANRICTLCGWKRDRVIRAAESRTKTYFIGQPFHEVLTLGEVERLESRLRTMNVDFYVRHPRERRLLEIGVPTLDKAGLIAEDAIVRHAGASPIHVIGWFSTVMFNLGAVAQRRTMLLFASGRETQQMSDLAKRAGCEVALL